MRLAVVGTGLMGASVGLAAKRAGVDWVGGHDADGAAAGVALERGAVDEVGPLDRLLAEADLAVVAAPVTVLPGLVEEVIATAPEPLHGDGRRLDEGLVAAVPGAVRRRPSGVRPGGAWPDARDR